MAGVKEIVGTVYEELERRSKNPGDVTGIPTGFKDPDKLLAGLQDTDPIIVAARPAMGKTAFALNLVTNAALRHESKVAVFSLEMAKEQLVTECSARRAVSMAVACVRASSSETTGRR